MGSEMKVLQRCLSLTDDCCDVVVFVNDGIYSLSEEYQIIEKALKEYLQIHPEIVDICEIIPFHSHPCGQLIYSPTGSLNMEFADSQNIYYAAHEGIKRAIELKFMKPLLILGDLKTARGDEVWMQAEYPQMNAILGALQAIFTPIDIGDLLSVRTRKLDALYVYGASENLLEIVNAMEEGRRITHDITFTASKRMSALNVLKYLQNELGASPEIQIMFLDKGKYPLMAAVNLENDKQILILNYSWENADAVDTVDTTLFMVGECVTCDSADCDPIAGDHVRRMNCNKGGAAAIAGFFKTLSLLKPRGLAVIAILAFVRKIGVVKSIGAYEIITSKSGRRVYAGNTAANGCMVMADLLCEAKELALDAANPFLFTVGSLTDHLCTAPKCYTLLMDNGPAREVGVANKLKNAGDKISDVAEILKIKRNDLAMVQDFKLGYGAFLQCNNLTNCQTSRGHQLPAAFLIEASGLSEHGSGSMTKHLPYTHVDVAGSYGVIDEMPTASPVLMFTACYVLPRL